MSFSANDLNPAVDSLFKRILNALKRDTEVSGYRLAADSGLDGAYVSGLLSGKKDNPSKRTLMRLCLAFFKAGASRAQLDGVLLSAGIVPIFEYSEKDVPMLLGPAVDESFNKLIGR